MAPVVDGFPKELIKGMVFGDALSCDAQTFRGNIQPAEKSDLQVVVIPDSYDLQIRFFRWLYVSPESLRIAQERAMVDGFFDYNPHTTTFAMEQQRYAREVAHHNDMIMRSDEAFQRQRFFGDHAYHDWKGMDNCMQYITEMPLPDQQNYGFH